MGIEKYMEIIGHGHHVSQRHPRMSRKERAAQFAPFAALTGYDSVIAETGRETSIRTELDEMQLLSLNEAMATIRERLSEHPMVRIRRFVPDSRKDGGSYEDLEGSIRNIDQSEGTLVLRDGKNVPLKDICSIEIL